MTGSATAGPRAPYPEPSPTPTGEHVPSLPVIVGGFLGATARGDGTLAAVFGSFLILATQGWGPAWIATGMAIGLTSGARWRLRVDVESIVYTRIAAWIIPVRRARYLLDARVELYEAWEDPSLRAYVSCPSFRARVPATSALARHAPWNKCPSFASASKSRSRKPVSARPCSPPTTCRADLGRRSRTSLRDSLPSRPGALPTGSRNCRTRLAPPSNSGRRSGRSRKNMSPQHRRLRSDRMRRGPRARSSRSRL